MVHGRCVRHSSASTQATTNHSIWAQRYISPTTLSAALAPPQFGSTRSRARLFLIDCNPAQAESDDWTVRSLFLATNKENAGFYAISIANSSSHFRMTATACRQATVPARHLGPFSHSTVSQQRPGGEVKWSNLVLSLDRSSHEDQIVLTTHLKHFPPPPPQEPTAPPTQTSTPTTPRSPHCVQGETARRPAPPRVRARTAAPHEARKVS